MFKKRKKIGKEVKQRKELLDEIGYVPMAARVWKKKFRIFVCEKNKRERQKEGFVKAKKVGLLEVTCVGLLETKLYFMVMKNTPCPPTHAIERRELEIKSFTMGII